VVRYSGTEALARVMIEAESEEKMKRLADKHRPSHPECSRREFLSPALGHPQRWDSSNSCFRYCCHTAAQCAFRDREFDRRRESAQMPIFHPLDLAFRNP